MESYYGTTTGSAVVPTISPNTDILTRYAGLSPPSPVGVLQKPEPINYEAFTVDEQRATARLLLVRARTSDVAYRPPDQQKRHLLRVPSRRNLKLNEEKWTFTKHEVGKAFNNLLLESPLPDVCVAYAVLASAQNLSSMDELWEHFQDPKLQKRQSNIFRRSTTSNHGFSTWLDFITKQGNVPYVRLMCQFGVEQSLLNLAARVALFTHDLGSLHLLFGFGASITSIDRDLILGFVRQNDIEVIKLLISSPKGIYIDDWQYCLLPSVDGTSIPDVLLQCIHHRPYIANGQLLVRAINAENIVATAILLAYLTAQNAVRPSNYSVHDVNTACFLSPTRDRSEHGLVSMQVCQAVASISTYRTRYTLYTLLSETGILWDGDALREEMQQSVLHKRVSMIKLLIGTGVRPSIQAAVSMMDFSILELVLSATLTTQEAQEVLSFAPDGTSEEDMLKLLCILSTKNLSCRGRVLDQKLIDAVAKRHVRVLAALHGMGAQVTNKSIQMALSFPDIELLQTLLQGHISPEQLSAALQDAMKITDRNTQRLAFKVILDKGVTKEALLAQLAAVVQSSEPDLILIGLMLQYKPPIHGENGGVNVFHVALRKAELLVIELLWKASPHTARASEAIPIAFSRISEDSEGARGNVLNETLVHVAGSYSPRALDLIALLINHGADANYRQGEAYEAVLTDHRKLECLCKACPVKATAMQNLFPSLLDRNKHDARALELVLQSAARNDSGIDFASVPELLVGHPNIETVVECLLKYGLDINLKDGLIIRLAVEKCNLSLFKTLLSGYLTTASLKTAFKASLAAKPRHTKLDIMSLLLDKAGKVEVGQSEALFKETIEALSKSGDQKGLMLLLRHKTCINANTLSIAAAASAGSTTVLETLLSHRPSTSSVSQACVAAIRSPKLDDHHRESVLKLLLDPVHGLTKADMPVFLSLMVTQAEISTPLVQMLIARRVEVSLSDLQAAILSTTRELFTLLARHVRLRSAIKTVFINAVVTLMSLERRLWVYQALLGSGSISVLSVSQALVRALKDRIIDVSLSRLLVNHGADVKYENHLPLKLAFNLKATKVVELLVETIEDDSTASVAFRLALTSKILTPKSRLKIYSSILKHGISKEDLSLSLVNAVQNGQCIETIRLLLDRGANPNNNGAECFTIAYTAWNEAIFRAMSPYANLDAVALAMIEHCPKEKHVVMWLNICMAELRSPRLKDSTLLYKAMTMFPSGVAVVDQLLKSGLSVGAMGMLPLCKQWKREPTTPLLWALWSDLKISNITLLELIARGDEAKPMYATPTSRVSVTFACMLDPKRNIVLEALLESYRDEIQQASIPGRSFSHLSQKPKTPDPTDMMDRELSLSDAALYLGNLKAYRSMGCGKDANNGSLHTAAFLALPEFVRWLLQWHSPDFELEEFGMMIPLVVACRSKARPWCRVANAEGTFEERRLKTMQLLARKSDLSWRNRRKTVLHFAIDAGLDPLKAFLEALDVAHDPQRNERYLYTDREGIVYSPSCYLRYLLDPDDENPESKKMVRILQNTGRLKDIMYRPKPPGPGVHQPKGYCGMPADLQAKWDARGLNS